MTSGAHQQRMAPRLSALRDGDLGRLQAIFLRRHVAGCADCQALLTALDQQVSGLRELRAIPPLPPAAPGDGWVQVRAALGEAPAQRPAWRPMRRPMRRLLPVPLLYGGAAAAALLTVGLWAQQRMVFERPPGDDEIISLAEEQFRQAEVPYQQALEALAQAAAARPSWSPAERAAYEAGLREQQLRLEAQRRAARSRPADLAAQEALYQSYQTHIEYVQEALAHGPVPVGAPL